ncbi:MAG: bacteriocin [Syntrophomonas sp.]
MESNKDNKLNDNELNSVTGGGWWEDMMLLNCGKRNPPYHSECNTCRKSSRMADGNRNNQLYKHCSLLNVFLE